MASGPHHEESELRNYQSRLESSFGLLEGDTHMEEESRPIVFLITKQRETRL